MDIQVDKRADTPVWIQIRRGVLLHIAGGHVKPKEKIPSLGKMAKDTGVNKQTVAKAYKSLASMFVVRAVQGSGYVVTDTGPGISRDWVEDDLLCRLTELNRDCDIVFCYIEAGSIVGMQKLND